MLFLKLGHRDIFSLSFPLSPSLFLLFVFIDGYERKTGTVIPYGEISRTNRDVWDPYIEEFPLLSVVSRSTSVALPLSGKARIISPTTIFFFSLFFFFLFFSL